MTLKTKLITSVSMFFLVVALLVVGVWAVSTAQVTMGGTISFTADNVFVSITGKIEGIKESVNLQTLNYSSSSSPTEIEKASWNNDISFDDGNLITYTITIKNNSKERSVYVIVLDNCKTTNIIKTMKKDGVDYESGQEGEIAPTATTTYTMTMSVQDLNLSVSAIYAYNIILKDANAESIEISTVKGTAGDPFIIDQKNANIFDISYEGTPKIGIKYPNRLDISNANFVMNSYSSSHIITKENNGITITAMEQDSVRNALNAFYEITAEATGKIWLSCEAEADKNIGDIGMRLVINEEAQYLCRGDGKLIESAEVEKGDTIKILLYARINSSAENVIRYKNIMLSYGTYTEFVPYKANISSYKHKSGVIVLDGSEDIEWENVNTLATSTSTTDEKYYSFRGTIDTSLLAEGVLPVNNDKLANIVVDGAPLLSYNSVYQNNIGIALSSTGQVSLYIGPGYNRFTLLEYLAKQPITLIFNLAEEEYIGLSHFIGSGTGTIIESNEDFYVSYSYVKTQKSSQLVCFGDSITGSGTNDTSYASIIGMNSDIESFNVGFSGTGWVDHADPSYMPFSMNRLVDAVCNADFSLQDNAIGNKSNTYKERLEVLKSIDWAEIEYVSMFFGTNDWNNDNILKSEDDSNINNKQRTNVEDSIKYCLEKFREKFPHIKIIVLTPYWLTYDKQNTDNTPNENNDYLIDFCEYIEEIAIACKVEKVINFYKTLDIKFENYQDYLYDGVHPNEKLNNIIASILVNEIKCI